MFRTFLSHGCNAALAALLLAWLALAAAGWAVHPLLLALGAAIFAASEYGFHRSILHAPPARDSSFVRSLQHRLHYDHHSQPGRLDLMFFPLWFLIPSLALTASLAALIWPDAGRATSVVAGIVGATLHYAWTHYVAHVPYRPRTRWGRWM